MLAKLLASKTFNKSPRLSRFLKFTVQQTLDGHRDELKEYVLGVEVFDRPDGYDPQTDPVVRVQAGRLRTRLKQYYESEGTYDPLIFEFSKGSYIPTFRAQNLVSDAGKRSAAEAHLSSRSHTLWMAGALLAVGTVAYWSGRLFPPQSFRVSAGQVGLAVDMGQTRFDGALAIAVLPFEDQSPKRDEAYFCDGMTDTLINALTKVDGLRVVARSSVLSPSAKPFDLGTIWAKLHVGLVIQGTVRREDNRLRVVAQLVDVPNAANVWSEIYDRSVGDCLCDSR
jgi:TolB-like protein